MSESRSVGGEPLTPVKRALLEIRELRARLADAEAVRREPIAIIGMGLRFPGGARDAKSFANLLWTGTDAVGDIPADRWSLDGLYAADPDAPGKMTTRYGAFLEDVDRFDAEFFGISPREAASMDPQQRLLLEIAWEALEDAGRSPAKLANSRTGVYLGISNNDYGRALFSQPDLIDVYFSTGNAYSVSAGRLSYFLGIHGPSIAVDTACSSSLVALHLACQGLRLGESDIALTGGVNLVLTPEMNINFSKARMMAADGRCKTFDEAADGYVRGEGCAVLVLRRLSDAVADGDRVLAVIRGSAVNQDGRSGGLTAPNGPAQEAVIRAALEAAQVSGDAISYVEAHGTGTPLGDPIEVGALGAALCRGREPHRPLVIGSVKTNIGHLEAAAGIAGVIKVVLGLQRREIPPNLHFRQGNPNIDWARLPIAVANSVMPWQAIDGRRLAGVSAFGFSGTNVHVIVEEAPSREERSAPPTERPLHLLTASARSRTSLVELAHRYEAALSDDVDIADACYTANAGRSHFPHRVAILGATADEMRRGLAASLSDTPSPSVARGHVQRRPQVAFLFTGQGAQYAGMGRLLYETSPVFRSVLDRCAAGLAAHMDRGLLDVLFAPTGASPINETLYAQPALFALEYALAETWRSWGIEPAAVLGHSLGEYVAACVAGVLPLDDGLRVVAERGRLAQRLAVDGAMGAVFAAPEDVAEELARGGESLTIAAYNGPEHCVISGERIAVETALRRLEARGKRVKALRVSFAAHSPLVESMLPAFREVLDTVRFAPARIALASNVSGALIEPEEISSPGYWLDHMRAPVRFAHSMQALVADGITHFVEIGPHPVLLGLGAECAVGEEFRWLPSLHRDRTDWSDLLESLQRLYVDGSDIDWHAFDRDYRRRCIPMPTYPFHRSRHWTDVVRQPTPAPQCSAAKWSRVAAAVSRHADQGPLDLNVSSYPAKLDCLARLTSAHAIATLRDAGLFAQAGERRSLDQVLESAGIGIAYRHLVGRWLDHLGRAGVLRHDEQAYVSDEPLRDPDLAVLWAETEKLLADDRPLLAYLRNCGRLVSDVLRGKESPLETLFPGGSFSLAEDLYERSAAMRYVNGVTVSAFEALVATLGDRETLRVIEIGAGTGGTTAGLLPVLAPDRTRYLFTDVSDVFLDRARDRFANYPSMAYGRLDLEQDLAPQGYIAGSFDLIVSANAVHACRDLRSALRRLHDLLAPGGLLILIEGTTHFAWLDMTIGLIEGWQHFADDLRVENPLLQPETWIEALGDAGFAEARAWPEPGSPAAYFGQHMLLARSPGEGAGRAELSAIAELDVPVDVATTIENPTAFRRRILDTLPTDRLELVAVFVRDSVAQILRLSAANLPARNDRLMDLGMDSLMAVQLRNLLSRGLEITSPLPATLMFDYPTIDAIASYLLARLIPADEARATAPTKADVRRPAALGRAAVAALSDAEIEARLLERLAQRGAAR